ncbi:hypothetical protein ACLOJK_033895 [Asimina triloba]
MWTGREGGHHHRRRAWDRRGHGRLFLAHGATVVIGDVQDEAGEAICHQLHHPNISYFHCDVTNEDDVRNLVDLAVQKHGKLDIMFNNAGVSDKTMTSILTIEKASMERVLAVNLVGPILGAKHAARVMVPAKKGCILFAASVVASTAMLREHAYVASKAGVVGLTKNVAAELGEFGIRVNCISPYGVATKLSEGMIRDTSKQVFEAVMDDAANLKGVTLKADDVAHAALFLASDESRYVSGLDLLVDGGYSVTNPSLEMVLNKLQL